MPLNLMCPSCRSRLQIQDQFAGRKVRCPTCSGVFVADAAAVASSAAAPPPVAAPPPPPQYDELDEVEDVPRRRRVADDYADERPHRVRDEDEPRRRYSFEEEDEPPRRRRRRDLDDDADARRGDDEEEERPRRRRKKRKPANTGLVIGLIAGGSVLLIAVIVLVVVLVVKAGPSEPVHLPGTTWVGDETLPGFGRLEFRFQDGQNCTMVDVKDTVPGNYTYNPKDNRIVLSFGNGQTTYEGTVRGSKMSGGARTRDPKTGRPVNWTWSLRQR